METEKAACAFLAAREAKGLSHQTLVFYGHWLKKLALFAPDLPLEAETLEAFFRQWDGVTRRNAYRAAHALYAWLVRSSRLSADRNPFLLMETPRVPKRLPRVFTQAEMSRILAAARPGPERAMVMVLLDGAARIGELVGRTKDDLLPDGLRVRGKRGERLIPLLPVTIAYLRELPTHSLFPVLRPVAKGQGCDVPATLQTLKKRFADIVGRAEVTGRRRGPHTVRHTAATAWLRSSRNIKALSQVLGHASVKETEVYVALLNAHELAEEHRKHSALLQAMERQGTLL